MQTLGTTVKDPHPKKRKTKETKPTQAKTVKPSKWKNKKKKTRKHKQDVIEEQSETPITGDNTIDNS